MDKDTLCIQTLRGLAMDVIDKANSGHPGMALGSAPILHTLFTKHIVSTAIDSKWIKRDRLFYHRVMFHLYFIAYCIFVAITF